MAVLNWLSVLLESASAPVAVLKLPVGLLKSGLTPMAVLKGPVVLFLSASLPRSVLPSACAAQAPPAAKSKKMIAAIRTERNEALVVEWRNICKPSLITIYYLKTA